MCNSRSKEVAYHIVVSKPFVTKDNKITDC